MFSFIDRLSKMADVMTALIEHLTVLLKYIGLFNYL